MAIRGLDKRFLAKMRDKLDHGRRRGYVGWDENWECSWHNQHCGGGIHGELFQRLRGEVDELCEALIKEDSKSILSECADIANFAMFIADYHDCFKD